MHLTHQVIRMSKYPGICVTDIVKQIYLDYVLEKMLDKFDSFLKFNPKLHRCDKILNHKENSAKLLDVNDILFLINALNVNENYS